MATPDKKPAPKNKKAAAKKSGAMGRKHAPTPRRLGDALAVVSPASTWYHRSGDEGEPAVWVERIALEAKLSIC